MLKLERGNENNLEGKVLVYSRFLKSDASMIIMPNGIQMITYATSDAEDFQKKNQHGRR